MSATYLWGLLTGVLATYLAFRLKASHEASQSAARRQRNLGALKAEIDYCAKLAATYEQSPFKAPLYRFPRYVFDAVYASLVAENFSDADISGVTAFYSQVDQMNRGLDAVDRYRASGEKELAGQEVDRLMAKAAEMRHPTESLGTPERSAFYQSAITAVQRHLKK